MLSLFNLRNLFALLFSILLFGSCNYPNPSPSTEAQIVLDSTGIDVADSIKAFGRKKHVDSILHSAETFLDTSKVKLLRDNMIKRTISDGEDYYRNIITLKNRELFKAKRDSISSRVSQPNLLALIIIVVVCGVIGGFAGPKINLLDNGDDAAADAVKNAAQRGIMELTQIKDNPATLRGFSEAVNVSASFSTVQAELERIREQADELKRERQRAVAYIIFGVIASALCFLALSLISSKILDFRTVIDYFVFAGYCLLSAVFAKKWIMQLYEAISTRK